LPGKQHRFVTGLLGPDVKHLAVAYDRDVLIGLAPVAATQECDFMTAAMHLLSKP
jgi:hypothetical protein